MRRALAVLLAWYFLAQATDWSHPLTVVGPFPDEQECETYRAGLTERNALRFVLGPRTWRCWSSERGRKGA